MLGSVLVPVVKDEFILVGQTCLYAVLHGSKARK